MNKTETLIMAISWAIAVIILYKWYQIYSKQRRYIKTTCTMTDYTLRTTYHKNIHTYYYSYIIKNEEYTTSDNIRFKIFFFQPKIGDNLNIYVDEKNPNNTITPFALLFNNLKFITAIILILIPILLIL